MEGWTRRNQPIFWPDQQRGNDNDDEEGEWRLFCVASCFRSQKRRDEIEDAALARSHCPVAGIHYGSKVGDSSFVFLLSSITKNRRRPSIKNEDEVECLVPIFLRKSIQLCHPKMQFGRILPLLLKSVQI